VVEVPARNHAPCVFVHGAQVVVMWPHGTSAQAWLRDRDYYGVHLLDFSWRGRSSLPRGGGFKGNALIDDEWRFSFETGVGVSVLRNELRSLSDGSIFCLVSCLSRTVCSGAVG